MASEHDSQFLVVSRSASDRANSDSRHRHPPFRPDITHTYPVMVQSRILAQGIFASYFGVILCLFWLVLNSLKQLAAGLRAKPRKAIVFLGLALGSFCHTWFCKYPSYQPQNTPKVSV
jgi:hypothetical protein